jgi:hypothetical protein
MHGLSISGNANHRPEPAPSGLLTLGTLVLGAALLPTSYEAPPEPSLNNGVDANNDGGDTRKTFQIPSAALPLLLLRGKLMPEDGWMSKVVVVARTEEVLNIAAKLASIPILDDDDDLVYVIEQPDK